MSEILEQAPAPPADDSSEIKDKLIDHIAKEIEMSFTHITTFRMRTMFAIWVGPYVLLGALIIASKGNLDYQWGEGAVPAVWVAGLSFLMLGVIGGFVEKRAWERCTVLRICLSELTSADENTKAVLTDHRDRLIVPIYIAVFLVIGLSFGAVTYVASDFVSQKQASSDTVEKQGD